MLIGLELPEVVAGLHANGIPVGRAIYYGILVTAILIATRIISSYVALVATRIFRPGVMPMQTKPAQNVATTTIIRLDGNAWVWYPWLRL